MADRQFKPSSDHSQVGGVRKRVSKACDRCRLKKSKCSGDTPCSRCRVDNTICVFGGRQNDYNKVYPKGYVEILERQQTWLVHGLQELYHRTVDSEGCWPDSQLKPELNDHSLIHDLLSYLGIVDNAKDERFEKNPDALKYSLWRHDGIQIQKPFDSSSTSTQSPVACHVLPNNFTSMHCQGTMSPTLPTCNLSNQLKATRDDPEPAMETVSGDTALSYLQWQEALCMQGVPNSSAVDRLFQEWPIWNDLDLLDEMDTVHTAIYDDLSLNNPIPSSASVSPMSIGCVQPNNCNSSFDLLIKENSIDEYIKEISGPP